MKIYKYANLKQGKLIVESGVVKLNRPSVFNDPFDNELRKDKDDFEKAKRIYKASSFASSLVEILLIKEIGNVLKKKPEFEDAKKEYYSIKKTLKKTHKFDESYTFPALQKLLNVSTESIKEKVEAKSEEFAKKINSNVDDIRSTMLVSCFSKNPLSILMWSHYADSHKGICIEYEKPDLPDFVEVKYDYNRPKIRISRLVSYISAQTILDEDYNNLDSEVIDEMMMPFVAKAKDWEYEQEIRCIVTSNSNSPNIVSEYDKYFYKMPRPTKIYFGCRSEGKEKNKLINFAKKNGIKCVFLKIDKENFKLIEK